MQTEAQYSHPISEHSSDSATKSYEKKVLQHSNPLIFPVDIFSENGTPAYNGSQVHAGLR